MKIIIRREGNLGFARSHEGGIPVCSSADFQPVRGGRGGSVPGGMLGRGPDDVGGGGGAADIFLVSRTSPKLTAG